MPTRKHKRNPQANQQMEEKARSQLLLEATSDIAEELTEEQNQKKELVDSSLHVTQRHLALALVGLVAIAAIFAMFSPNGMAVFDKLLPVLMFVLGWFFRPAATAQNNR